MQHTLATILRAQAERHPDAAAFTFLGDDGQPAQALTYGALDTRARAIAARLPDTGSSVAAKDGAASRGHSVTVVRKSGCRLQTRPQLYTVQFSAPHAGGHIAALAPEDLQGPLADPGFRLLTSGDEGTPGALGLPRS